MSKLLSVLIPSRNERFLVNTVNDLLQHATGEIEIIVSCDGYWPDPPPPDDKRVKVIHFGAARGMRACINAAAGVARGEYLMKCDAHTLYAEGFDEVLKANCDIDWVVIPRRKRLDAEHWTIEPTSRPDIDYEYLSYPLWKEGEEPGLHGTIWTERIRERFGKPEYDIDDNPAFQGSCWFTTKRFFDETVQGLQEEGFGTFIAEPQELGMKAWLSGGAVKINKLTWYAHLHKGKRWGRGYYFDRDDRKTGNAYSCDYWMNDRWKQARHTMEWFINEKFPDMPGWSTDWRERVERDKINDYSALKYKDDEWLAGLRT